MLRIFLVSKAFIHISALMLLTELLRKITQQLHRRALYVKLLTINTDDPA